MLLLTLFFLAQGIAEAEVTVTQDMPVYKLTAATCKYP